MSVREREAVEELRRMAKQMRSVVRRRTAEFGLCVDAFDDGITVGFERAAAMIERRANRIERAAVGKKGKRKGR